MKFKICVIAITLFLLQGCAKEKQQIEENKEKQQIEENIEPQLNGVASIDGNTYYQTIDGLGFSSAWCGTLTTAKNDALYNTLGFSLLRVRFDQNNAWTDETNNAAAAHARGAKVLGCPWKIPTAYRSGNTIPSSQYVNFCNWLGSAASAINCDFVSIKNEPDGSSEDGNLDGSQIRDIIKAGGSNIGKPIFVLNVINFTKTLLTQQLTKQPLVLKFP